MIYMSQIEWNESFDWDVQGNNLFDEKVKKIFSSVDINVDYVSVSVNNDLKVGFSNSLILETFINVSSEIECWRFFEKGNLVRTRYKPQNHNWKAYGYDVLLGRNRLRISCNG